MATTASVRATTPTTRQRPTSTSPTSPPSIARGATARSAVSRTPSSLSSSVANRRASVKLASGASPSETRESLSASLKHETERKEQLLVQIQNKEQTITNLTEENSNLTSALSAAETRINELYAEQARSETDLAQRIEVAEKLRTQVRELEKEKRDLQRRYNEQTATFEAERQAFYDNEQHLKSRIQSLSQQLRQRETLNTIDNITTSAEEEEEAEPTPETQDLTPEQQLRTPIRREFHDPEDEPAEMTAVKLELSTLSTSYSSLQSTLVLLQSQLVDLKRVNREVQEENESYIILLQEKTLSGQFNLMRQVGQVNSDDEEGDEEGSENLDSRSMHSNARSTLDPVDELAEESFEEHAPMSRHSSRTGRRRAPSTTSSGPRGETLADLPISGPGLDLAAELGRAENKDMLGLDSFEDRGPATGGKPKRSRRSSDTRKVSSGEARGLETSESVNFNDIDALRNEVKSLKDANKALSLYASKIIDRIISQEGFEHVLAVDYDKQPSPAAPKSAGANMKPPTNHTNTAAKARSQSVIVERTASAPVAESKKSASPPIPTQSLSQSSSRANRRSLSFDWRGFSLFSPTTEKKTDPNLRPLTLQPGASPVTGVRKLDNQEDEDDRKERERLNATMKLMGIEPSQQRTQSPSIPPSTPTMVQRTPSTEAPPLTGQNRRFSFWGFKNASSDAASVDSKSSTDGPPTGLGITPGLTQEALEQAEAQNTLAALDAHERSLSAELARGGSSGFTEISPRLTGRRSRRSGGGSSGSTVWSAGMSVENE